MIALFFVISLTAIPAYCSPIVKTSNGILYGKELPEAQAFFQVKYLQPIPSLLIYFSDYV